MIDGDDRASAEERSSELADQRVTYFWDAARSSGKLWQRVLHEDDVVWDVYFLYRAAAKWEKQIAPPDFWMSNPAGTRTQKAPALNEPEFERKAKELLDQIKSNRPSGAPRRRETPRVRRFERAASSFCEGYKGENFPGGLVFTTGFIDMAFLTH